MTSLAETECGCRPRQQLLNERPAAWWLGSSGSEPGSQSFQRLPADVSPQLRGLLRVSVFGFDQQLSGDEIGTANVASGSNSPVGSLREQSLTLPSNQAPRPAAATSAPEHQLRFGTMQRFTERACKALLRRLAKVTAW